MNNNATVKETLLSVKNLKTWFELKKWGFIKTGFVRAVNGVNFELKKGEAVAFVGESGCGKSTLAKTLLGLCQPTEGEVFFNNRLLSDFQKNNRKEYSCKVGYVQQDPYGALPPFMDIKKILSEPLIIHGVSNAQKREERINQALEEVRLTPPDEFLSKFPHMLSGGQQQRIVIARALILKPLMLIADEPVSMLDASVRVEILNLLRSIQKQKNLTLAFITHDLSTVRHFADRIFVMYAGNIIEVASVNQLLDKPKHPYTQALLDSIADVDANNALCERAIPEGEPPSLINPPSGCLFHPRCKMAIKGVCDIKEPAQVETTKEHFVSCFLYSKKTK